MVKNIAHLKYDKIRVWGGFMGSYPYYIEQQQRQALEDKAPIDAVYYIKADNRWITSDEVKNPHWHWYLQQSSQQ